MHGASPKGFKTFSTICIMLSLPTFAISDISSNSVHFVCGLNALCRLNAILSGTDGKWGLWVSSSTLSGPQSKTGGFSCLDIGSEIPCNQAAGKSALKGFSAMWQVPI